MAARYMRFVRALALVSSAASAGCDDEVLFAPDALAADAPASDTTTDTAPDADAMTDAMTDTDATDASDTGDASSNGLCRTVTPDGGPDLPCAAGGSCSYSDDASAPRCSFDIDAAGVGGNIACGGITCAEYCFCAGPAASVCGCIHGSIGPLSPPEMRQRGRRARRRSATNTA